MSAFVLDIEDEPQSLNPLSAVLISIDQQTICARYQTGTPAVNYARLLYLP